MQTLKRIRLGECRHIDVLELLAEQFINQDVLPLPGLMVNEDGELGMYWDDDNTYVDLEINDDCTVSIYTRIRKPLTESFFDNSVADLTHIAPLIQPLLEKKNDGESKPNQ